MRIGLVAVLVLGVAGASYGATKKRVVEPVHEEADHSGWYGGVGLGVLNYDVSGLGVSLSFSPIAGYGQFGYAFSENIAVEARAGLSGKDTQSFTTNPLFFGAAFPVALDVQADHFFSVLLRGSTSDLGSGFRLYGLVGGTSIKDTLTFSALGIPLVDASGTDSSISFGGGAEKEINDQLSIGVEYLRLYTEEKLGVKSTVDGVTVNARFKF